MERTFRESPHKAVESEKEVDEIETKESEACCGAGGNGNGEVAKSVSDTRAEVKAFYGDAAASPKVELCCPVSYSENDTAHIPQEVMAVSYGCGSPIGASNLQEGNVVVDLGSGGGIDAFIASPKVGPTGRVVGVDMTREMLEKAEASLPKVVKRLGYNNVEFRHGFLEEIPLSDGEADVVVSNCVVNLSGDKGAVFEEIYRVLKDGGRFCISDILSGQEVPDAMKADKQLWGECISGAIREDAFIESAKGAGFYGVEVENRYLYREVEGLKFYSVTVKGYKLKRGAECLYEGHYAIYNGPFKSVFDDEGHEYPVGVPVEVCTDTVRKLQNTPYRGLFSILDPDGLDPDGEAETCGPRCC